MTREAAYICLADGGKLSDPKYNQFPQAAEARLKDDCRRCWQLRKWFPEWVQQYIERWKKTKDVRGVERPGGEADNAETVS